MIAPTSFFADYGCHVRIADYGCHVRILEEARALQNLGHIVTIATYHSGGDAPGLEIRRTMAIPWRRNWEVGSSRHKIVFDMLLGLKTLGLLASRRFDVIHAHLHEGALIGLAQGLAPAVPVWLQEHIMNGLPDAHQVASWLLEAGWSVSTEWYESAAAHARLMRWESRRFVALLTYGVMRLWGRWLGMRIPVPSQEPHLRVFVKAERNLGAWEKSGRRSI
jgi:hypothetical protein